MFKLKKLYIVLFIHLYDKRTVAHAILFNYATVEGFFYVPTSNRVHHTILRIDIL